jgi:hypothetical protein
MNYLPNYDFPFVDKKLTTVINNQNELFRFFVHAMTLSFLY